MLNTRLSIQYIIWDRMNTLLKSLMCVESGCVCVSLALLEPDVRMLIVSQLDNWVDLTDEVVDTVTTS